MKKHTSLQEVYESSQDGKSHYDVNPGLIPYFLVWLVPEVSDDWNLSAACAETPVHLLGGRLHLATKLKPCAQQYVLCT